MFHATAGAETPARSMRGLGRMRPAHLLDVALVQSVLSRAPRQPLPRGEPTAAGGRHTGHMPGEGQNQCLIVLLFSR